MGRTPVYVPGYQDYGQISNAINGGPISGQPTQYPYTPNVDVLGTAPGAVQAVSTGSTIAVAAPSVTGIRLSAAAAATGVILAAGTEDQQEVLLFNESANAITFAAVGTSNVANGTSASIASLTGMRLIWNAQAATPSWYVS